MPFLTLINGAGKWMWKGGKPFDWESPMYKEEGGGLLYKKLKGVDEEKERQHLH